MTCRFLVVALLAMLAFVSDARAQCLLRVSQPETPVYVSVPCEYWIGVYSRSVFEWTGEGLLEPVPGPLDVAPDGIAFLDDAIWAASYPPGSVITDLQFYLVNSGIGSQMSFTIATSMLNGTAFTSPTYSVRNSSGVSAWNAGIGGGGWAVESQWSGGVTSMVYRNGFPGTNPCALDGWNLSGSSYIPHPYGLRRYSEARYRTYMDSAGNLGGGPGGSLWSGEFRLSTTTIRYDNSAHRFVYRVPPDCSLPNPSTAGLTAMPSAMVVELRMYAGAAPSGSGALFQPGEWPDDPANIPNHSTDDWFTQPLGRDPADTITPGVEGGLSEPSFLDAPTILPEWLPDGTGTPEDLVIVLPLSDFSPMADLSITIRFEVWNPVRLLIRAAIVVFCWIACVRALWDELGGGSREAA